MLFIRKFSWLISTCIRNLERRLRQFGLETIEKPGIVLSVIKKIVNKNIFSKKM